MLGNSFGARIRGIAAAAIAALAATDLGAQLPKIGRYMGLSRWQRPRKGRQPYAGRGIGNKLMKKAKEHRLCGPMTARRHAILCRFAALTKKGYYRHA